MRFKGKEKKRTEKWSREQEDGEGQNQNENSKERLKIPGAKHWRQMRLPVTIILTDFCFQRSTIGRLSAI